MSRRHVAMLLLVAGISGSNYTLIKVSDEELTPSTIAFLRLGLASLILAPLALRTVEVRAAVWRARWPLTVAGLGTLLVPSWLLAWGETRLDSGLAAIITASAPLFVALLAQVWVREERSTGLRQVGILVGFAGVAVLVGAQPSGSVLAALALVVAAVFAAGAALFVVRRLANVPVRAIALGSFLAAAIAAAPGGIIQAPEGTPSWKVIGSVFALGTLSAGAVLLYFALITGAGASRAILINYLVPPVALAYGVVFLRERLELSAVAGLVLILLGTTLGAGAQGRQSRIPPQPQA